MHWTSQTKWTDLSFLPCPLVWNALQPALKELPTTEKFKVELVSEILKSSRLLSLALF